MISASNIYVQYGDRILLNSVNVVIGNRDRIGLVGRNGAGKSTLMKILANYQSAEKGTIAKPSNAKVGFLHQDIEIPKGKSVMQEALTAFAEAKALEKQIAQFNEAISTRTDYESADYAKLLDQFSDANDRFQLLGGYEMEAKAEKVLLGLGFKPTDFDRPTQTFSGGWQMRIELAKILLQQPDYVLLDEPTNHLDIESIIWLEGFLKGYEGAVVIISHDKTFLNNVTTRTVEVELGQLYDYKASYSKYLALRQERREKQIAAYKNQQKQIQHTEKLIDKFRAKANKAKMAQSLIKQLDRMDRVEIDNEDVAAMKLRFPPAPRSGDVVLDARQVYKSYGDNEVIQSASFKMDRGDRVAFVGQNGQGKTTFAKVLIDELNYNAGEIKLGHNVKVGYYAQDQSERLPAQLTVLETIERAAPPDMQTRVRSILGAFLFSGEDQDKKVSVLSGGERARLAMACLLLKPINLLVLDEPTNHLDIISKEVLKEALQKFDGSLLLVSHDRDFLGGLTNRTIEFRDKALYEYLGDVNFFLDKRKMNNMREVSLQESQLVEPQKAKIKSREEMTPEERKAFDRQKRELEKAVLQAERKIEKTEKAIAEIEAEMAKTGFYESDRAEATLKKYQELKNALDPAMEAWEEAQMTLEELLNS
ncbi:MAG: ABC-F family ATP-binding cassette domain-containing protein [Bacteroidota bacterium]